MYPNLAISNRVYPEHLSEKFCDIYEDVYIQRKQFAKGTAENAVMKLALNGTYGESNNEFSCFYDPKFTMTITINGQLSLCLLADYILKYVKDVKFISFNTDGLTVKFTKDQDGAYRKACKEWEQRVKLELEFADYSVMYVRDVNNYISVYTNGKTKNKGAYEYKDLPHHKDQSNLVVRKAVEAAMVYGKDLKEFISNHEDKWDFMLRTKVPKNSRLVLVDPMDGSEVQQQNICRYYISKDGGKLVKIMPPVDGESEERRLGIDTEWLVTTCNYIEDIDNVKGINYDYYIAEAEKLLITEEILKGE